VSAACAALLASGRARAVRIPALDVRFDRRLRVALAVTTLHRGGAERVVLDLAAELRALGHEVLLAVLDRPSRSTFAAPEGTVHLQELARSRAQRIQLLADLAIERGADLVHVHLADGEEVRLLARAGVPVIVSVHNARGGWPAGLEPLGEEDASLVVACSRAVAAELRAARITAPLRVIWNGIVPRAVERKRGEANALHLLVVANHRPQKRLERIPAIVAALRARGHEARAVLVGEPVRADPASLSVADTVRAEAERLGVADAIELLGSREDLTPFYASASVVVSASAFEGLSLVHLEALSAGVPLVTTAVGGTSELAAKHSHVRVVDVEAGAEAFADAILAAVAAPVQPLAPELTARCMAQRHLELFERAVPPRGARTRTRGGLLLVTNNFSTGGAQSSARRLLRALDAAGVRVNAVVLEEQREHPTKGRAALEQAGVAVHVAPRAGAVDPLVTAREVERLVDRIGPDAVVFWNAIAEHKVLILDRLPGVAVWDVSPGEMYFGSFERYFAAPRASVPYLDTRDYGRLLAGAVVKYEAERARAEEALGVRVSVIPNGVVVPPLPTRRAAPPAGAVDVIVGTLARLSPDKKLEQLIDAARHGGFSLRIAGGV
jgi:glycosyltransferase involved in cell wall biosynthesis